MYEMRGITKVFDAVVALDNASFAVSPGEIRALLGSNGSGKSTMIKVLAGIYQPNAGELLCDGKPIRIRSGIESQKHGIATAFQELSLIPEMSVIDNVLLGSQPLGKLAVIDSKTAHKTIEDLLGRFQIDCEPDAYVQTLMPSTKAMLEVAKAVLHKPKLLLLDEVTASLHYDEIQVLFKIIRELRDEGVAIAYVTHRMNEVFELCDNVTIMRGGETVKESPVGDITLDEIVFYMTGRRPESRSASAVSAKSVPSGAQPLLDANALEVYPKVWDISMQAHKGEIIGIAGLQGQGQPEFIRALLGAEKVSGGTLHFDGSAVSFKSPGEAVRSGIGFVSGDRNREAIFPVRTISENIAAGMVAKGNIFSYLSPKKLRSFAAEAVGKYNIKIGRLGDAANTLSGGNQQKLVIARWIAMNPMMLLLDDPTKGVDYHSRLEIHETLKDCAKSGMTVIISSSEYEELIGLADRIYVFYEGVISDVLSGERMTGEHIVAAMMGMQSSALQNSAGKNSDEQNSSKNKITGQSNEVTGGGKDGSN